MVADGVHVLLGPALVMVLLRTDRVEPYLVALLLAGVPDLDRFLFGSLVAGQYLSGPVWVHRGLTHSLLALALFVGIAYLVGEWRAGAIGYGSHLAADFLTGGVRLFVPFDVGTYGLGFDWLVGSAVAGTFSGTVLFVGLLAMVHRERAARVRTAVLRRTVMTWGESTRWRRVREAVPDRLVADRVEQDGDR